MLPPTPPGSIPRRGTSGPPRGPYQTASGKTIHCIKLTNNDNNDHDDANDVDNDDADDDNTIAICNDNTT